MSRAFLVDTDIISACAPSKARAVFALVDWMDRNSVRLYISVITLAEVEAGIAKSRRLGATRKADILSAWLETVLHLYRPRVLSLDIPAARIAGQLSDHARAKGHSPAFADVAIAALARQGNLTVLTRNIRHFEPLDVPVHDPLVVLPQ